MRIRICFLIVILWSLHCFPAVIINGVTGGRLGDKLLTYTRALWVAWRHNIDLLVRWFPYADELKLWSDRTIDPYCSGYAMQGLAKAEDVNVDAPIMYDVGLYFSQPEWHYPPDVTSWIGLSDNKNFIKELRKKIAPCRPLLFAALPNNRLAVAMHIRRGGGYDAPLASNDAPVKVPKADAIVTLESMIEKVDETTAHYVEHIAPSRTKRIIGKRKRICYVGRRRPRHSSRIRPRRRPRPPHHADKGDPLKFPPLTFYVDALSILMKECRYRPLYVYIFTDDKNPLMLQRYFEEYFRDYDIVFNCRAEGNSHDRNVLDDMFDMARYDYLIRPDSSYSKVAQLIGDYEMILYPHEGRWSGNMLKITKIMKYDNVMTCIEV